jgi:hypothetical protein
MPTDRPVIARAAGRHPPSSSGAQAPWRPMCGRTAPYRHREGRGAARGDPCKVGPGHNPEPGANPAQSPTTNHLVIHITISMRSKSIATNFRKHCASNHRAGSGGENGKCTGPPIPLGCCPVQLARAVQKTFH